MSVYRLTKLKTPLPIFFVSQNTVLHECLPKVAEFFMRALSEQDAAKSHDNDVFDFDSSSAILKIELRESWRTLCSAACFHALDQFNL